MSNGDRHRWAVLRDALRSQLWPVPAFGIVAAAALGVALPDLDARVDASLPAALTQYLFSGGPEAARSVLSTVAGSLITATSLTFSLTLVTLQLASSQFSPRLLRTFARDGMVHATLALLLATFTFALTVLRTVRASLETTAAFVPQMSVTLAYLLGLASVLCLVAFLAHLARQLRVESLLRDVREDTSEAMRRVLPDSYDNNAGEVIPVPPHTAMMVCARTSGFLTSVDERKLLSAAVHAGAVVSIDRSPGAYVVAGTPLGCAWCVDGAGALDDAAAEQVTQRVPGAIRTGFERTAAQDIAFGLRQLADVAIKALSPGTNDPTTAVHTLGHISALLCEAVRSDLGPRVLRDDDGRIRVVLRRPDLAELLDVALAQARHYGASDPEVLARLFLLVREVAWSTDVPAHQQLLAEQLELLLGAADRENFSADERRRVAGLADDVRQAFVGRWRSIDGSAG